MLKKILIPCFCAILTALILKYVLFIGGVPSVSMEPALHKGDIIAATRIFKNINEGDIVIFKHENKYCIKRVAAVGPKKITIDEKEYFVPQNCLFMLGDNYDYSYDSRFWKETYIRSDMVIAKLLFSFSA